MSVAFLMDIETLQRFIKFSFPAVLELDTHYSCSCGRIVQKPDDLSLNGQGRLEAMALVPGILGQLPWPTAPAGLAAIHKKKRLVQDYEHHQEAVFSNHLNFPQRPGSPLHWEHCGKQNGRYNQLPSSGINKQGSPMEERLRLYLCLSLSSQEGKGTFGKQKA